jgi:hypothetical protein
MCYARLLRSQANIQRVFHGDIGVDDITYPFYEEYQKLSENMRLGPQPDYIPATFADMIRILFSDDKVERAAGVEIWAGLIVRQEALGDESYATLTKIEHREAWVFKPDTNWPRNSVVLGLPVAIPCGAEGVKFLGKPHPAHVKHDTDIELDEGTIRRLLLAIRAVGGVFSFVGSQLTSRYQSGPRITSRLLPRSTPESYFLDSKAPRSVVAIT